MTTEWGSVQGRGKPPQNPPAAKRQSERLTVAVVVCPAGVWTRIRGPLSGAWYGPWRFTDVPIDASWAQDAKYWFDLIPEWARSG